jgi:hypothetical protein
MAGWGKETAQKTRKPRKSLAEEMGEILFKGPSLLPDSVPSCIMIYGKDGTGKTGLALSMLNADDVKEGKKIIVVDLDAGNLPIILEHHKEKVEAGSIIYYDPMEWGEDGEGNPILDYDKTFQNINAIAIAAKKRQKEEGDIKAIILDGGSKLFKYAENEMRALKELDASQGAEWGFWKIRNKIFLESLELYKSLLFDKVFIFHDDFVPIASDDKPISSAKLQTNQMMFQKVLTERRDLGPRVEYRATIHKSKFDIAKEGQVIVFGEVDKTDEKYKWEPEKVTSVLRKQTKKKK